MITLRWHKTDEGHWHLMVLAKRMKTPRYISVGHIYPNGIWIVHGKNGEGGQNSSEQDIQKAKDAVVHCAIMDGFIPGIQFEGK